MKLTEKVKYGILVAQTLQRNRTICAKEIAAKHGKSLDYLHQTLLRLKIAGVITSKAGTGGGYLLAPCRVTLLDLIRAISPDSIDREPEILENFYEGLSKYFESFLIRGAQPASKPVEPKEILMSGKHVHVLP